MSKWGDLLAGLVILVGLAGLLLAWLRKRHRYYLDYLKRHHDKQ